MEQPIRQVELNDKVVFRERKERPVHRVTLSSYRICKYQVTQDDWEKIMGDTPSEFCDEPARGEDQWLRPVECVSWYAAIEYCNKRSVAEGLTPCYAIDGNTDKVTNGKTQNIQFDLWDSVTCDWNADGYRLPTEAEWEYAARGGGIATHQTDYASEYSIDEVAWYGKNSGKKTHQVGLKKPNAAGLYDMSGNVWEWCYDRNGDYSSEAHENPIGASSGRSRVVRGGSWLDDADGCRVSYRNYCSPAFSSLKNGFRICRRA